MAETAADLYPGTPRAGAAALLTRPQWSPTEPLPLETVTLQLDVRATPAGPVQAGGVAHVLPAYTGVASYAEAVAALDRPQLLQDRPTWRLTHAALTRCSPSLGFAEGTYFDVLNIGEATAHEYTARYLRRGSPPPLTDLPLRAGLGDPTDPARRPMLAAITTLTLRHDRGSGQGRFLVHWRDPAKVATNGGAYQVTPVGMFQPTTAERAGVDFDLWRCMAREYSEELLGASEHDHVDYDTWSFYRDLQDARAAGQCRPYLLGIGVDPLSLATDILTAVVFTDVVFDRLFARLVEHNSEGRTEIRGADGLLGTPFAEESVARLITAGRMQPAGAATLDLAWRHHRALLG